MPNKNSIGSLFRFKDHLHLNMLSSVVYKYSCAQCASGTYVGSTTRALHMRIAEHRGRSFRTGKLVQSPKSSIREHQRVLIYKRRKDPKYPLLSKSMT